MDAFGQPIDPSKAVKKLGVFKSKAKNEENADPVYLGKRDQPLDDQEELDKTNKQSK
jgi:hypothetical protein